MKRFAEKSAGRAYRILLRAFPREFRERNGQEMELTFLAHLRRQRREQGWPGALDAWLRAAGDALVGGAARRLRTAVMGRCSVEGGDGTSEESRGVWEMFASIRGDIRFALRALVRRPLFAVTIVLSLAVGIGANASVFTLVDGLLFTPLPYEDPEELVTLWTENPVLGWSNTDVNPADAWDWRKRSRSLEDLAVHYEDRLNLTGEGPPELVAAVRSTPNILGILGREPVLGRGFLPEELGPERDDVVILMNGFWERRFVRDRNVLGSTLTLDGKVRTVIGVMPPDFRFLADRPDVLLPLNLIPWEDDRGGHYAEATARLAPGTGVDEARTELRQIARQLQAEYPEANENWTVQVIPLHEEMLGPVARQASIILIVAVGFVLLMVCVNVANLLLARGETRARELAVRTAIGAGRGRVIRQLLTEALVLAVLGGGLGLLLANWGYRAMVAGLPSQVPPVFEFGLDGSVLAFTALVTVASALLFGIVPALRSSVAGAAALRDGGRGGRSTASARFGSALVVLQTATAVVLLVGGGLLMKSISGMRSQDFGFDPRNVLTVRLAPPAGEYPEEADLRAFWNTVEERVVEIPGVIAVGNTQSHPLMGSNWGRVVRIAGQDEAQERRTRLTYLSGGLFQALGLQVVSGRPIRATDDEDAPMVAVVNEDFVSRYLGEGANALEHALLAESDPLRPIPVVGVIRNVVERGIERPPEPSIYLSIAQANVRSRSLVVRTAGPPGDILEPLQQAVWSVDPKIPLFQIETMEDLVDRRVGSFSLIANLMGLFALLSLFLGAVGIYGVTAFTAGRRTGEIGVRLALGAERGDVVRMVVRQGGKRALVGLALGLTLAYLVAGTLESVLVEVNPRDPVIFAGVAAVLGAVSFLGLWIPAWRASAVNPVGALSSE